MMNSIAEEKADKLLDYIKEYEKDNPTIFDYCSCALGVNEYLSEIYQELDDDQDRKSFQLFVNDEVGDAMLNLLKAIEL